LQKGPCPTAEVRLLVAQALLPVLTALGWTAAQPGVAVPHDGRACIAVAENRWWFAKGPHAPLVFFLEVLILSGFKG